MIHATLLLASLLAAPPPQPAPPVISLKTFTSTPRWELNITWHADETYEDDRIKARLEMTATARFILERKSRADSYGHWESQKEQTSTCTYKAFVLYKKTGQRTDWTTSSPVPFSSVAVLQVGGQTPGYQLNSQVAFPGRGSGAGIPPMFADQQPLMLTTHSLTGRPDACSGPLPDKGANISGSAVHPAPVGPFCGVGQPPPMARVGITYTIQPHIELAPLTPVKKQPRRQP